jgi:cytochrome P450
MDIDPGDIIHLNVGGTHIVALHSVDIGMELLQGKGSIYSDRPTLYVAGELVGMSETTFLLDDGPKLKESRRWFTQEIGSKQALARFEPMVQTRTKRFIKQLLADSGMQTDFVGHLLTYVDRNICYSSIDIGGS